MTARFPLFDFMPYGAPELMAAARGHMARAQALSCALMVALFAAALALVPRIVRTPETAVVMIPPHTTETFVPNYEALPHTVPSAVISHGPRMGVIVPAPDDAKLEERIVPTAHDGAGEGTHSEVKDPGLIPLPLPVAEAPLPGIKDVVVVDELPVAIKQVKPEYPDMAREAGFEDKVLVHFLIGKDGRVLRAVLDEKVHSPIFDPATLEAAKRWVFTPAMTSGHPVVVWVTETFVYTLH